MYSSSLRRATGGKGEYCSTVTNSIFLCLSLPSLLFSAALAPCVGHHRLVNSKLGGVVLARWRQTHRFSWAPFANDSHLLVVALNDHVRGTLKRGRARKHKSHDLDRESLVVRAVQTFSSFFLGNGYTTKIVFSAIHSKSIKQERGASRKEWKEEQEEPALPRVVARGYPLCPT